MTRDYSEDFITHIHIAPPIKKFIPNAGRNGLFWCRVIAVASGMVKNNTRGLIHLLVMLPNYLTI